MIISRKSPRTGIENAMDIDITPAQLAAWSELGELIQRAMPNLTNAEREFIKTGYTQADWEAIFPPEDDDLNAALS